MKLKIDERILSRIPHTHDGIIRLCDPEIIKEILLDNPQIASLGIKNPNLLILKIPTGYDKLFANRIYQLKLFFTLLVKIFKLLVFIILYELLF